MSNWRILRVFGDYWALVWTPPLSFTNARRCVSLSMRHLLLSDIVVALYMLTVFTVQRLDHHDLVFSTAAELEIA